MFLRLPNAAPLLLITRFTSPSVREKKSPLLLFTVVVSRPWYFLHMPGVREPSRDICVFRCVSRSVTIMTLSTNRTIHEHQLSHFFISQE